MGVKVRRCMYTGSALYVRDWLQLPRSFWAVSALRYAGLVWV